MSRYEEGYALVTVSTALLSIITATAEAAVRLVRKVTQSGISYG
jgi:hypothetical protein